MERGAETTGSICFDAREVHHLAPLLGFVGDEILELGGRAWKCGAAQEMKATAVSVWG